MKFILHRDRTVPTTRGHFIEFKKGEPTYVPPDCYDEVIAVGAVPEEELVEPEQPADSEPTDPVARRSALFDAFDAIVLRNNTNDFTAGGVPGAKAVTAVLGWAPDNKERTDAWNKYREEKGEA